jgi:hypothetical protein
LTATPSHSKVTFTTSLREHDIDEKNASLAVIALNQDIGLTNVIVNKAHGNGRMTALCESSATPHHSSIPT